MRAGLTKAKSQVAGWSKHGKSEAVGIVVDHRREPKLAGVEPQASAAHREQHAAKAIAGLDQICRTRSPSVVHSGIIRPLLLSHTHQRIVAAISETNVLRKEIHWRNLETAMGEAHEESIIVIHILVDLCIKLVRVSGGR